MDAFLIFSCKLPCAALKLNQDNRFTLNFFRIGFSVEMLSEISKHSS